MRTGMSDFPFRIVGFDLDGTLVDTAGDLTAAVNHALARIGRAPLAVTMVRPMIGLGARHMLEQGLIATGGVPAGDFDRLLGELLAYYEAHIAVESRPYPGLIAALELVTDKETKAGLEKPGLIGTPMMNNLLEAGVISRAMGDAMAFCPPMIITEAQVDEMMDKVGDCLDKTAADLGL